MASDIIPVHPYAPVFVIEDLPYNRLGTLSPRQKTAMNSDSRGCLPRVFMVDVAAVFFIVIVTGLGAQFHDHIVTIPLMVLMISLPFWFVMLKPRPQSLYAVKKAEGKTLLTLSYGTKQKYHAVVVDKIEFRVSAGMYSDLENGDMIAVYYTSVNARHTVVSWERL